MAGHCTNAPFAVEKNITPYFPLSLAFSAAENGVTFHFLSSRKFSDRIYNHWYVSR